jgi:hypothetical protein
MGYGITNKQAHYLAMLQRDLKESYSGWGMSRGEAADAIDDCLRRLGRPARPRARPVRVWTREETVSRLVKEYGLTRRQVRALTDDFVWRATERRREAETQNPAS